MTDTWRIPYQGDYENKRLVYRPLNTDAQVQSSSRGAKAVPLQAWLNANRPELFLEGDRLIDDEGRLLNPGYTRLPFDTSKFVPLDWQGGDFTKESQRPERRPDSIQFHMSAYLRASTAFDVLIDDDGPGEAADLVGLRVTGGRYLDVTLVHCKYTKATAGLRIDDLYEVCGQAVRSAKWRRGDILRLLDHLRDRAQRYMERTNGISPYVSTARDRVPAHPARGGCRFDEGGRPLPPCRAARRTRANDAWCGTGVVGQQGTCAAESRLRTSPSPAQVPHALRPR
ncbi:hypothetical protein [Kitasatospora sp. NPDC050463]|uniref:hypothetical protein n=1 Tax=Kitasatospora sp. NPDC050463 TaxID=3155786 RepID=UPI0033D51755